MIINDGSIYVVGGKGKISSEKYDINKRKWFQLSNISSLKNAITEFKNPNFVRDDVNLMSSIKRKRAQVKSSIDGGGKRQKTNQSGKAGRGGRGSRGGKTGGRRGGKGSGAGQRRTASSSSSSG